VFRLIKTTKFDFMSQRKVSLTLSAIVVVAAIAILAVHGLNKGIEFTGGTTLQVKFVEAPDVAAIRGALSDVGLSGQQVTTIGEAAAHEVVIRLPATGDTNSDETQGLLALDAVRDMLGVENHPESDLNVVGSATLATSVGSQDLADAILERRKEKAIFSSFDELNDVPGMTAVALASLKSGMELGPLSLRKRSYVGPAVGEQLVQKTLYAIVGSLVGMLLYIWIRFQLQWGFAAVVALAHDTVITLGLFSIFNQEMSLPVVAAFLTLVGYSVNDTVVVFDRIRENLRTRGSESIEATVNKSINQTLSRTIITSGLTWVVVLALLVFGGAALKPFAFVLSVGVVVGTYSSIYVASPFLVIWTEFLAKRRRATATKVPASTAS
jgi:preprotein translocase subunit SecF